MLRLAPTRISLTPVDLDWHVRRHEKRLAKSRNGETVRVKAEGRKTQTQSSKHRPFVDSDPIPTRQSRDGEDPVPIYSDTPVPQHSEESQPFWGGILAEVGAAARRNQTTAFRSHSSDISVEIDRIVRFSFQRQEENDRSQDGPLEDLQISPRSPESHPLSPASSSGSWTSASTQIQSRPTPTSLPVHYPDEDSAELEPSDSSDQEPDLESAVSNATAIQSTTAVQAHRTRSQHSLINRMDVDGSSDAGPHLHHYRSTSSLQDPEPALRGMPFGAQARRAELAASRSASSSIDLGGRQSDFGTPDHASREGISPSHSYQTRTRSGGLPRSRLYISEVMASSSPEKRQRSAAGSDQLGSSNGIGSVPTRVRKRYKRRDSSSFAGSETSDDHAPLTHSDHPTDNPFGRPPRSSPPEPIPYDSIPATSSPGNLQHLYHDSHFLGSPSAYPNSISIHSSNYSSSYDDLQSYDYSLLPRQPFHPLPTPPTAMPRTPPNNNNTLPFRPVSASENDSHIQYPYAPTAPASRSSSITPHPTHISIYNDSLPSYSQPQTPVGLPRNGLPRMYLQNPYYTAPARPGAMRGRVVGNPDVFATPTRAEGRRGVGVGVIGDGRPVERYQEQENVSVDVERERREQRDREMGGRRRGSGRGWRISEWEP
ncbi:MAG: hypothetical protein LQ349_002165 [Xanthoria aureola]|nr:MAG: hypothetical protein LQ349_002165 [Xanthoria aureola]